MTKLRRTTELFGRILLVVLFLLSGCIKVASYSATADLMISAGLPAILLPLVILFEVAGSIAIVVGWKVRVIAMVFAGYALATALLFHANHADQVQMYMFLKNLSIAGAFLLLSANGAGPLSLDARKRAPNP